MIPSPVPNPREEGDWRAKACNLAERWGLESVIGIKLARAQEELPFDIWIFSGARSRVQQEALKRTHQYVADFDRSTHADEDECGCPRLATGVDVQPTSPAIRAMPMAVAQLGAAMTRQGFRWGGGAPVGQDGIPVANERWHFDLGPRPPPRDC